jgi:hypothetical protein
VRADLELALSVAVCERSSSTEASRSSLSSSSRRR